MSLLKAASALAPRLTALRRAIHAEPELGLHNPKTAQKIRADLAALPLTWREGPSSSGLIATLQGAHPGPTTLLRGDTDALPMPEETGLDFASKTPGIMHACGHDSHVAMLAGAAHLLSARQQSLKGTVQFMFQPGEEGHHGARHMLNDGLLTPLPERAYALHIMPNSKRGIFAARPGPIMASADMLHITITGKGGHASMPQDAIDPLPIACEIVTAIQTYITRNVSVFDPAVLTIAKIHSGTTHNVIPDTAHMLGTIRTLSAHRRAQIQTDLARLIPGIAAAHGATANVTFEEGFPVTINHQSAITHARHTAQSLFGEDSWEDLAHPIMAAEDFAYVLEKTPGAMIFLGAAHNGADWQHCCGLHNTHMILDESVMPKGAAYLAALAENLA